MSNKWPKPDFDSIAEAFGKFELDIEGKPTDRWENSFLCRIDLPYPMRLSWDLGTVVHKITCNQAVRSSLSDILDGILKHYGSLQAVQDAGMDLYGGCYCFRRMRGGSQPSLHSWAVAIDLSPDANPLGKKWEKGMMPLEVVEIFNKAGWLWGGTFKNRPDCQHFQATQPYV